MAQIAGEASGGARGGGRRIDKDDAKDRGIWTARVARWLARARTLYPIESVGVGCRNVLPP